MKKFKIFDVWISALLILASLLIAIFGKSFAFIIGYFIVGGWQIISMLVHIYNTNWISQPNVSRKIYCWVTALSLLSFPIGGYIILLLIAPLMAFFYTYICYEETYKKMKRPLDDLR